MGKRRRSRDIVRGEKGSKGKKGKQGQTGQREPKPTVYRKPYHVNHGQSLAQIHDWGPPTHEPGGLRGRWGDAIHRPLGQLSVEQLELLLTQGADANDLHYLWPVLFARLRENIDAAYGTGLLELITGQHTFWARHPHAVTQLAELIETNQERLEQAPRGLASVAANFMERYRPTRDR